MKLIFLTLLLISSSSLASKVVGNGGNIVRCKDGTVMLLDLYEASRDSRAYAISLPGQAADQKIEFAFNRLREFSPKRAEFYSSVYENLARSVRMIDGAHFPRVDDSGELHVRLPRGCHVEQIAVQEPFPFSPTGKRLIINDELYDKLDENNRAALLLHEVITSEAILWGSQKSTHLRPFTAFLVSRAAESASGEEFIHRVLNAGLLSYEAHGLVFSFDPRDPSDQPAFDHGVLVRGTVSDGTEAIDPRGLVLRGTTLFYPNGHLKSYELATDQVIFLDGKAVLYPRGTRIDLSPEGNAVGVHLPSNSNGSKKPHP